MKYNVYSSLLGGFIAMGFSSEKEAMEFIDQYHDRFEAKTMRITKG